MRVIKGFKWAVKSVAFSSDGRLLATGGAAGKVGVWDALTGEPRGDFEVSGYGDVDVQFADDRHVVVSSLSDAAIWDAIERKLVKQLYKPSEFKSRARIDFLSDGTLVLARHDKQHGVWLLEPGTWKEKGDPWQPPEYGYWNVITVEPGGMRMGLSNGYVVDARTGKPLGKWGEEIRPFAGRGGSILAWCPRKPLLAVSNRGKTIEIIDPNTGEKVTTLTSPSKYYEAFAFTPDSRHLIAVSNDRVARLYDTATWAARETLDWGIGPLKSIAVTADGSRAAAGSGSTNSGKVVIWDLD